MIWSSVEFYVSSSADAGGLFLVNFQTGHCERVLSNGSKSLKQVHGICSKLDSKVELVDRGANKVKEFDVVSKQVTNLAGSAHLSRSQQEYVARRIHTCSIFVVDSSSGRLRLITSVQALIKYLQNLWLFLSAFNLIGTKTRLSFASVNSSSAHAPPPPRANPRALAFFF